MHAIYPVMLAALLFAAGVYGVLARRNTIGVLMSVELMLGAVNLNLVTFDVRLRDPLHAGQVMALFVIAIAAAEAGLGLAIVLLVFRNHRIIALDRLRSLSDREPPSPEAPSLAAPGQTSPGDEPRLHPGAPPLPGAVPRAAAAATSPAGETRR
jgi:NADH-quinone oxidoreductase subunit K